MATIEIPLLEDVSIIFIPKSIISLEKEDFSEHDYHA